MPDPGRDVIIQGGPSPRVTTLADAMSLALSRAREAVEDDDPDPYGYLQDLDNALPGVGVLEPQWVARPGEQKWEKRVRARARKAQVSQRFLMGQTVSQIASGLGVSEATIYRDLTNLQMEWKQAHMADIEALAGQDLARLDYLMQKLAEPIERSDVSAIKAALDIIKTRTDILGYKSGVQVDMEEFVRASAEAAGLDPNEAVIVARRVSVNFRT